MRILTAIAAVMLLTTGVAHAQVSSTVTATNDYDFRGYSQSAKDPALQASIDWAADSGLYLGAWASNVDFGDGAESDYEVDFYAGFSGGAEDGLGWTAGIVYYSYWPDDDDVDYAEISAGLSYGPFSGKVWYANDYFGTDTSAEYVEGNLNFDVGSNFSVLVHAGYAFGEYWDDINGDTVIDYSAGVGYALGHFNLVLKYVDTDSDTDVTTDVFNNEGRAIFTIATTFPWSSE